MTSAKEIESILLDAFEDVALLIGATAVNHLDDAVIWTIMRRLHRLRLRALSRLPDVIGRSQAAPAAVMPAGAHSAVEQFLHLNRSVSRRTGAGAGKPVEYALVNDEATLLYLVNQGTLTFHPWLSRVGDLDRPDFVLFDLDPGQASFAALIAVAKAVKATLDEEGVESFIKTSGKTGLHVLTPCNRKGGFDQARAWALGLAERTAGTLPGRATVDIRKAKRGGRVYIDVLQNARGHHVVPPYVLRAVPGATVSTPLAWREVTDELDPGAFTLKKVVNRMSRQKRDPMAGFLKAIDGPRRGKKAHAG